MLAAVDYVSREAAEAKRELASEIEERAAGGQDKADDEDSPTEFAGWIHQESLGEENEEAKKE